MGLFKKVKPKEIWDDDDGSNDDLGAVRKVREICAAAANSADAVAVFYYGPSSKIKKYETERYVCAKKRAEEKASQISDDLLRDAAIRDVLYLCMRAKDVESAGTLFHQLQTKTIKEIVMGEHPFFHYSQRAVKGLMQQRK